MGISQFDFFFRKQNYFRNLRSLITFQEWTKRRSKNPRMFGALTMYHFESSGFRKLSQENICIV